MDANGILNVLALEKATGKENKITITNDKGRLSKTEIERMVAEAEKFKNQDEQMRKKVDAKNDLENTCYSIKNQIGSNEEIENKVKEVSQWIEIHQTEEAEVYEEKKKELMEFVSSHAPAQTDTPASGGPDIEEVD